MGMRSACLAVLLLLSAVRGGASACTDPAVLGIDLSQQAFCDPLVPEQCMLPFPNDYFTVADSTSGTRRRIHFTPEGLPKNVSDVPLEAAELNRSDGFSPGAALLFWMPAADLVRSNAPAINDIGRSLEPDSPIVIIDARNGKRVPLWAERDLLSAPGSQSLHRASGDRLHRRPPLRRRRAPPRRRRRHALPPSPAFAAYRDGTCTTDATFESRRPAMEKIFQTLAPPGSIAATSSWRGTSRSPARRSTTGRMLHIRDDAFKALGSKAPSFTDHVRPGEPVAAVPAPDPGHVRGPALPDRQRQPRPALRARPRRAPAAPGASVHRDLHLQSAEQRDSRTGAHEHVRARAARRPERGQRLGSYVPWPPPTTSPTAPPTGSAWRRKTSATPSPSCRTSRSSRRWPTGCSRASSTSSSSAA